MDWKHAVITFVAVIVARAAWDLAWWIIEKRKGRK